MSRSRTEARTTTKGADAFREGVGIDPKRIVRDGYDLVSQAYRSEGFEYEGSGYREFLSWLVPRLKDGDRVLDVGCGCGVPVAEVLSGRFDVLGVDISPVQIERARRLVPGAEFRCADVTDLDLPHGSFEAIVAFFSIIHVPMEEQPALFDAIASWLTPGGLFLASVGWKGWTGTEPDWCGVRGATMYWSHADADTYRAWLEERGFEVLREGFLPEDESGHTILLAQRS